MELGAEIQKKVAEKVEKLGITAVETKSTVNYRTIKKIVETGVCSYGVYQRIIAFLEAEAVENKDILSKI